VSCLLILVPTLSFPTADLSAWALGMTHLTTLFKSVMHAFAQDLGRLLILVRPIHQRPSQIVLFCTFHSSQFCCFGSHAHDLNGLETLFIFFQHHLSASMSKFHRHWQPLKMVSDKLDNIWFLWTSIPPVPLLRLSWNPAG
jgi:hypothetical protein